MRNARNIVIGMLIYASMTTLYAQMQAQTIYKCGHTYSNQPCVGAKIVGEVTAADAALANHQSDAGHMLQMMRNGQINDARTIARNMGEQAEYAWALQRYKEENRALALQMVESAQAEQDEQQNQLYRQQQERSNLQAQNSALMAQHSEDQQQRAAEAAQQQSFRAARRAQDMAPKFNPATGQWCQSNGGTVECH